jgi:hypothetical protein
MNISICAPTRERPHDIKRLIHSVSETAKFPEMIEFCFYCDDDDIVTQETLHDLQKQQINVKFTMGPRTMFSDMWNHCHQLACSEIIMMGSDDIVFRTKNWDHIVLDKFDSCPDKILFVYGDDLKQGSLLGTHGFLHQKWIQLCGYFTPPYFSADYCDTWINLLAQDLKRKLFLPDVVIEHMHVSMKKAIMDNNARDRVMRNRRDDNRGIFYSPEKTEERNQQILKLKKVMDPSYQIK